MDAGHSPDDILAMPWRDVQTYLSVKFGMIESQMPGGDR